MVFVALQGDDVISVLQADLAYKFLKTSLLFRKKNSRTQQLREEFYGLHMERLSMPSPTPPNGKGFS